MHTPDLWLLVEDEPNDAVLFKWACDLALKPQPLVHWVKDGRRAKEFLNTSPTLPVLIISDLKMPNGTGLDLLKWVRTQPNLKQVRFVVVSDFDDERVMGECRSGGADDYLLKPSGAPQLVRLVKKLEECARQLSSVKGGCDI